MAWRYFIADQADDAYGRSAALYPLIRDGLDAFADALSSIKQQSERQLLKVTTTNAFASNGSYPACRVGGASGITLEVIGTDAVLDLAAGEADLAIRYMYAAPSGFIAHELFRDAFGVAVCNPGILPGGQPLQSLADLRNHTLVHSYWSPSDTNAPTWQRWLEAASAVYHEVPSCMRWSI